MGFQLVFPESEKNRINPVHAVQAQRKRSTKQATARHSPPQRSQTAENQAKGKALQANH